MKKLTSTLALFCIMNITQAQNPFLEKYTTPHGTAPFNKIKTEHFEPALQEGMKKQMAEIYAIVNNPEAPSFKNTIVALDKSGALLNRVQNVFGNLLSAETNDDLQTVAEKMMPLLTEHGNNISLNKKLFERVKAVYSQINKLKLTKEETRLLQKTYDGFVRNGANLEGEAKVKYRALTTELSKLTLQYGQNILKETNNYELVITDKAKLAGLPESTLEAAALTAKEKEKKDGCLL
jgi:Zn-dependent oligopeptidases